MNNRKGIERIRRGDKGTGGEDSFKNLSGFEIKVLYGPEDISHLNPETDLGLPGEYPFTRGIHKTMYRQRPWTIRQLGSLDSPSRANERIRHLLKMGATGISLCLDMPTIMGKDSDDPLAEGEVGSCGGVAIDSDSFTSWNHAGRGPDDECRSHEDCGRIEGTQGNLCQPDGDGIWRCERWHPID